MPGREEERMAAATLSGTVTMSTRFERTRWQRPKLWERQRNLTPLLPGATSLGALAAHSRDLLSRVDSQPPNPRQERQQSLQQQLNVQAEPQHKPRAGTHGRYSSTKTDGQGYYENCSDIAARTYRGFWNRDQQGRLQSQTNAVKVATGPFY